MKAIYTFLAISLVSVSSFACPYFTGDWICKSTEGETVRMNLNSINKEDYSMLMIASDVGTKVQTTEALYLNVGKQKGKDYTYSAICKNSSIVVDLDTVFGPITMIYTSLASNEMLISSSSKDSNTDKVMSCKKLSLLD